LESFGVRFLKVEKKWVKKFGVFGDFEVVRGEEGWRLGRVRVRVFGRFIGDSSGCIFN